MAGADPLQYTDCAATIRAAMHGGSGNPSGPGGTGAPGPAAGIVTASGAVAASPEDIQALAAVQAAAAKGHAPSVTIGGKKVTPGNAGLSGPLAGLAAANTMPPPLLVTIVLLAALAVVTTFLAARGKFPAVRSVALRIFRR